MAKKALSGESSKRPARMTVPKFSGLKGSGRKLTVVTAYEQDPLVHHGKVPAGLASGLVGAMESYPARLPTLTLPVLLANRVPALYRHIWPRVQRSLRVAEASIAALDQH